MSKETSKKPKEEPKQEAIEEITAEIPAEEQPKTEVALPEAAAAEEEAPTEEAAVEEAKPKKKKKEEEIVEERFYTIPLGGTHLSGQVPQRARRIRVDRLRLHRRADSLLRRPQRRPDRLAVAQLLFRHGRLGRLPQGPLLPLPERVDQKAHGSRRARQLELESGPDHPGDVLQQRR